MSRAYSELESWIRQRLESTNLARDLPEELELTLRIPVRWRGAGRASCEKRFEERLEKEVAALRERVELDVLGYRSGHLHCHWCRSSVCEHSLPPAPRSIFVGYEPTGVPRWRDFSSWIVDSRDPRVERLFLERPIPLAVCTPGPDLVKDLLAEFGRRDGPYHIVAQVTAGPFLLPMPGTRERQPLALTTQLVERRTAGGNPDYDLNLIAAPPHPHHLPTLVAERVEPRLSRFVAALRKAETDLRESVRSARKQGRRLPVRECRERGRRFFDAIPGTLEKILRRGERRSHHAETRSADPERPTASARQDALEASSGDCFRDRQEGTWIIRGPRRRVHVFREDGTHITSIVYPTETIRERIRIGRWAATGEQDAEKLKAAIEGRGEVPFS